MSSNRPVTRSRAAQIQPQEAKPKTQVNQTNRNREVCRINKTPSFSETFLGRLQWKQRHYDKPVTSTPLAPSKAPAQKRVASDWEDMEQIISPIQKPIAVCIGKELEKIAQAKIPKVSPPRQTAPNPPGAKKKLVAVAEQEQDQISLVPPICPPVAPAAEPDLGTPPRKEFEQAPRLPLTPIHKNVATKQNFSQLLVVYGKTDNDDGPLHVDPNKITKTYASRKSVPEQEEEKSGKQVKSLKLKKKRLSRAKSIKEPKTTAKTKGRREKLDAAEQNWVNETNKEFENILNFPLCVQKTN